MTGFIIAMEEEISSIKDIDKNVKVYQTDFYKYFLFEKNMKEFVLAFCGIGKTNAAACTLEMIKTFSLKQLINIGICGVISKHLKSNTILLLKRNYYLDVDITDFGYAYGQIPKEKDYFENYDDLNNTIKKILKDHKINFTEVNGGTVDTFISIRNINNFNKKLVSQIDCIDMEACAIKQIANKSNTKTAFIKVVSDSIYNSKNEYNQSKNVWPKTITNLICLISEQL